MHVKPCLRKPVSRKKLLTTLANVPPYLIEMEACSGAHYWSRELCKQQEEIAMTGKFVPAAFADH